MILRNPPEIWGKSYTRSNGFCWFDPPPPPPPPHPLQATKLDPPLMPVGVVGEEGCRVRAHTNMRVMFIDKLKAIILTFKLFMSFSATIRF